jgi:hypothetical protein
MFVLFFKQCQRTLSKWLRSEAGGLRQAMNAAHALGMILGYRARS